MLIPYFISINLLINFFNIGFICSDDIARRKLNDAEEFGFHLKRQYVRNYDQINNKYKNDQGDIIDDLINDLTRSRKFEDYLLQNIKYKNSKTKQVIEGFKPSEFEISSENDENSRQESIALEEGGNLESYRVQKEKISPQLKQSSFNKADQASIDVVKVNLNGENVNEHDLLLLKPQKRTSDFIFYSILIGCIIAGLVVTVATGFCLYAMHKSKTTNLNGDYPQSYNNPKAQAKSVIRNGDKGLAHSAQMYHYQHQKQQMIAMEKANDDLKPDQSDDSEGETDEGDYTVYECPGLAPTGEMEVKNPLFKEDFGSVSNNNTTTNTNETTIDDQQSETQVHQINSEVLTK